MRQSVPGRHDDEEWVAKILNSLYHVERAMAGDPAIAQRYKRYVERMKNIIREQGWFFEDPDGQRFSETRNDLEASIAGDSVDDLVVVDVIKPIIRRGDEKESQVVQRGVVVVEARMHGGTQ